jgi:hypothetical protein
MDYVAIPFGKNKYYLKENKWYKLGYKTVTELPKDKKGTIGYENFDAIELERKLLKFKQVDKVKPTYPKLKYN